MQERRVVVTPIRRPWHPGPGPAPARAANGPGRTSRQWLIPAVAVLVVGADQATKTWALHQAARHVFGPIWVWPTLNSGAAFGLGRGVTPIVEAIVVVLVVWLVVFSRRAGRGASVPAAIGLGLLLGGAAGNLIDRIFRHHHGAVIDFIDALRIGSHDRWPVFNVADASIVVGVIILGLCYTRRAAPSGG